MPNPSQPLITYWKGFILVNKGAQASIIQLPGTAYLDYLHLANDYYTPHLSILHQVLCRGGWAEKCCTKSLQMLWIQLINSGYLMQ